MKWFDRWFNKKVTQALCVEKSQDKEYYPKPLGAIRSNSIDAEKVIRFTVSKAQGGMVVETSFYDRHTDRSNQGLYIITDNQDLGKELSKIITIESLKQ